jgi:hypothetical protein
VLFPSWALVSHHYQFISLFFGLCKFYSFGFIFMIAKLFFFFLKLFFDTLYISYTPRSVSSHIVERVNVPEQGPKRYKRWGWTCCKRESAKTAFVRRREKYLQSCCSSSFLMIINRRRAICIRPISRWTRAVSRGFLNSSGEKKKCRTLCAVCIPCPENSVV